MAVAAVGAFFHTPGPKELYVRFRSSLLGGAGTDWQCLGTCVLAPEIDNMPSFINVMNDYGGRSVPTQVIWDGSESRVVATVNRVDLAVCRNVRDQPAHLGLGTSVGRESNVERGTLMIGVNDFELAFRNTYFGTANATPGLPPGRLYYSVTLDGYRESTQGTRVEDVTMVFQCHNLFLGGAGFAQFTEDPSEFPVLIPT